MTHWKKTLTTSAGALGLALACAMTVSAPAQAQMDGRTMERHGDRHMDRSDGRDRNSYSAAQQRREWERDRERDRRDEERRRDEQRRHYQNEHRGPNGAYGYGDRGRGVGPRHDWYRGGYVSAPYRGYSYVVGDWRTHRLSAPPRGYQWIQYGGDYLLIAIGTGLIANIVFNPY